MTTAFSILLLFLSRCVCAGVQAVAELKPDVSASEHSWTLTTELLQGQHEIIRHEATLSFSSSSSLTVTSF